MGRAGRLPEGEALRRSCCGYTSLVMEHFGRGGEGCEKCLLKLARNRQAMCGGQLQPSSYISGRMDFVAIAKFAIPESSTARCRSSSELTDEERRSGP